MQNRDYESLSRRYHRLYAEWRQLMAICSAANPIHRHDIMPMQFSALLRKKNFYRKLLDLVSDQMVAYWANRDRTSA